MKQWLLILILLPISGFSQIEEVEKAVSDSIPESQAEIVAVESQVHLDTINYLEIKNPMKASLYSAILPGMGQIYNGKWWKAPIVWGALGTGAAVIIFYNDQYHKYRGYYLTKLYGGEIDNPTFNNMSVEALANIQDDRKRTRDYAIALTALGYILNILDATVDAHLFGIDKDPDLSFRPAVLHDESRMTPVMGMGLTYRF